MSAREYLIVSWNIDGLRDDVWTDLKQYLEFNAPDVLCLNETKKPEPFLKSKFNTLDNYHYLINVHDPSRFHGVAMLIRKDVKYDLIAFEMECGVRAGTKGTDPKLGRVLAIQLIGNEDKRVNIIATYCPNSGVDRTQPLKNLAYRVKEWDPALMNVLEDLHAWYPTIWIGDINVAPEEIDVSSPKTMSGKAGFTKEERENFRLLMSGGARGVAGDAKAPSGGLPAHWVDIWRHQHPEERQYSYRGYNNSRSLWRLDNCVISDSLRDVVNESFIETECEADTDHVPIGIKLLL